MISILSYGGGTNSTAVLIGLVERGETVDYICFADTGSEKPHTYDHVTLMDKWCRRNGLPGITVLHGSQPQQIKDGSLHEECLRLGTMPSKVYGIGTCSQKWKVEPQHRFAHLIRGQQQIEWLIGFDADEPGRAARATSQDWEAPKRFPLIEWEWGREDCVDAIARAGLPQPGKSACWMCPSSKKAEVLQLQHDYPDLLDKALEMERRALAGEGRASAARVAGLGRGWAWGDLIASDREQRDLFSDFAVPDGDCMCIDG